MHYLALTLQMLLLYVVCRLFASLLSLVWFTSSTIFADVLVLGQYLAAFNNIYDFVFFMFVFWHSVISNIITLCFASIIIIVVINAMMKIIFAIIINFNHLFQHDDRGRPFCLYSKKEIVLFLVINDMLLFLAIWENLNCSKRTFTSLL